MGKELNLQFTPDIVYGKNTCKIIHKNGFTLSVKNIIILV